MIMTYLENNRFSTFSACKNGATTFAIITLSIKVKMLYSS
jgi:hypothetical protein